MPHRAPHVVFAGGPIGPLVAARLAAAGRRVQLVRRSAAEIAIPGVETVAADPLDASAVRALVRGAGVVYHNVHAAFLPRGWEEALPRVQANLVEAAGRAGARLVVLDGLEAYGRSGGLPIGEDSPQTPCSRQGELRAVLFEGLAAAACRGDVRASVGRASDLFGPAVWEGPHFGERFWKAIAAGRPGTIHGDPETAHTWHYTADVAAALVILGLDPASDGHWMLPCAPAVSTRALAGHMAAALGRTLSLARAPRLARAALAVAVSGLRDQNDLEYRWEEPYVVDDGRFRERYGDVATPLHLAARQTVDDALARLTPRPGYSEAQAAQPI